MIKADAHRRALPFADGNFRPMFPKKKEMILELYDKTVRSLASCVEK